MTWFTTGCIISLLLCYCCAFCLYDKYKSKLNVVELISLLFFMIGKLWKACIQCSSLIFQLNLIDFKAIFILTFHNLEKGGLSDIKSLFVNLKSANKWNEVKIVILKKLKWTYPTNIYIIINVLFGCYWSVLNGFGRAIARQNCLGIKMIMS